MLLFRLYKRLVAFFSGLLALAVSLCDVISVLSPNLKGHLQIHTGEKPFMYNMCYADVIVLFYLLIFRNSNLLL